MTPTAPGDAWTRSQVVVVSLCFAINMIDGMDVLVLSYIAPTLQQAWMVDAKSFGIVFSAGLAGMAFGGLVVAPTADRVGRKPVILVALAVMSGAMLASAHADGLGSMILARVVVGAGIGTVFAAMAAMAAEHAPPRHRHFAVGVLQAGYPAGATLTGFVVAAVLPHVGWRGVLTGTALTTLAILPLLAALRPRDRARSEAPAERLPIGAIVARERLRASLLLWAGVIACFAVLYFIVSWITRLAIEAGLQQTDAIVASALYNLGSMGGTIALSVLAIRVNVGRVAAAMLGAGIAAMLVFGGIAMPVGPTLATAFVLGLTLGGGVNGFYPLAAGIYPSAMRSTGIGWAMGIGRIGAFSGPLIGGAALSLRLPLVAVFGLLCVPLAVAAACALALGRAISPSPPR